MIPIILIYLLRFCTGQSPEMKYVVNMDSQLECCDEESLSFVDISEVSVGRYNETFAYMFGNSKLLKPIGPDMTMIHIIVQKEFSGSYETIGTHEICDVCGEVAKGQESNYYVYVKYLTIPDECPFEVDDYPVKDFIVDTDDLPLNSHTAGRYQAFMTLYKNPEKDCKTKNEFLFCLTLKFIIEMA